MTNTVTPHSLFIGLLSGTSMDAIDAGLFKLSDPTDSIKRVNTVQTIATYQHPFPADLRCKIIDIAQSGRCHLKTLGQIDRQTGELFATAAKKLIQDAGVSIQDITAIGCHGQTLYHHPETASPYTLQVGDPNIITHQTRLPTITDFRRADIVIGGQGAPWHRSFTTSLFNLKKSTVLLLTSAAFLISRIYHAIILKTLLGLILGLATVWQIPGYNYIIQRSLIKLGNSRNKAALTQRY